MSKSTRKNKKGCFGIGGQARLALRDKQYRAAKEAYDAEMKKKAALEKRKATLEAKKKEESLNNKPVV